MQHFYASVPDASHGNGAAHLTNYALHNVAQRTRRMRDPRMRAIRHVSQLQSLWAGDIGNYKWGGRQPVRRRRGDVHGDMTSVVLRVNWPGQLLPQQHHTILSRPSCSPASGFIAPAVGLQSRTSSHIVYYGTCVDLQSKSLQYLF